MEHNAFAWNPPWRFVGIPCSPFLMTRPIASVYVAIGRNTFDPISVPATTICSRKESKPAGSIGIRTKVSGMDNDWSG
jgi:hypothetical protein